MSRSGNAPPSHSHESGDCGASGKYTEYIKSHLDKLQARCDSFTACINELLQDESPLLILKGENISLNKTCGLVYNGGNQGYYTLTNKCSQQERNDIRNDIEHHLKDAIFKRDWKRVKKCLENNYGDNERITFVDEICGLASKQKELCGNFNTHKTVETFFNEQIQHLKCTCESIHHEESKGSSGAPVAAIAGASVGGLVFLVLVGILCFCFYKRRKSKKKKKSPNVIYLPAPNGDNHPVYQEVFDDRPYQSHGFTMSPSSNPPTLPMRYTPQPKANKGRQDEEPAYLEPIEVGSQRGSFRPPLPRRGQPTSNPNYEAPPEYTEQDTERKDDRNPSTPDEGRYFQPLPTPPGTPTGNKDDPGYDKLEAPLRSEEHRIPPEGYETVEEVRSSIPLEDAPRPVIPLEQEESVPLGPVPATRTKKSDRQTESHYFLLEGGSQKKHSEV